MNQQVSNFHFQSSTCQLYRLIIFEMKKNKDNGLVFDIFLCNCHFEYQAMMHRNNMMDTDLKKNLLEVHFIIIDFLI